MAKRRHHKKVTHRRRRHHGVHGVKGATSTLTNGLVVIAGVAAAGLVVTKLIPNQSDMIKTIAPIALGIVTPMVIKSDLGKFAGLGMIAYGGSKLLTKVGIAGLGADTYEIPVSVAGDMSLIAGADDFAVAGDEDYAMGYDDISVLAGMDEA